MRERERSAHKKETRIDRRRWSAFGLPIYTMHREVTQHRRTMITSVRRSPIGGKKTEPGSSRRSSLPRRRDRQLQSDDRE